jgi:hypothetical protein
MTELPPPTEPPDDDDEDLVIELGPARPVAPEPLLTSPPNSVPTPPSSGMLVIEPDDLDDADGPFPAVDGTYPPVAPSGPGWCDFGVKKKGLLSPGAVARGSLVQMMAAAALGAFVAWLVLEPGLRASELNRSLMGPSVVEVIVRVALFGGVLGGFVGLALGAVEGVTMSAWSRAVTGGGLGLLIGGAGGAMGGVTGQLLFSAILGAGRGGAGLSLNLQTVAARAFGWALVGAFVGLAPGVQMGAQRKIMNGLLGGLIGGFIGGLLFDPIGALLGSMGPLVGTPSRFVGMIVLGLCTGLGIGLVEEIRKEAWLILVAGPLAGKQFILYKGLTYIGSAPAMDIPLVKDRAVAPKQCVLEAQGAGHVLRDLTGGGTLVNGRPVDRYYLRDRDNIQVGRTLMEYHLRPLSPASKY